MDDLSSSERFRLKKALGLTEALLHKASHTVESALQCMQYPDTLQAVAHAVPDKIKNWDWLRRVVGDNDVRSLTRGLLYLAHCGLRPSLAKECTSFTPIVLKLVFAGAAHANSGAPGAALALLLRSVRELGACARDPSFRIYLVQDVVAGVMACWRKAPMTVARDHMTAVRRAVLQVFEVALGFLFACPTSTQALCECAAKAMLDYAAEFGGDAVAVLVRTLALHVPDSKQEPHFEHLLTHAVFLLVREMIGPGRAEVASWMHAACQIAVEHLDERYCTDLAEANDAHLQHARREVRLREALPTMLGVKDYAEAEPEAEPDAETQQAEPDAEPQQAEPDAEPQQAEPEAEPQQAEPDAEPQHCDTLGQALRRAVRFARAACKAARDADDDAQQSLRDNHVVLTRIPEFARSEFAQQCGGDIVGDAVRLTVEQAVNVAYQPVSLKLAWHYAEAQNGSERCADFLAACLMCDLVHPNPDKALPSADEMCDGLSGAYLTAVQNVRAKYLACNLRPPRTMHEAKQRFEALYFDTLRFGGNDMTRFCVACLRYAHQGVKTKRAIKPVPSIDEQLPAAQRVSRDADHDDELQKWMLHAFARAGQTGQNPDKARRIDCVQSAVETAHKQPDVGRVVVLHVGLGQKMTQAKKLHAMATQKTKDGSACVAVHVEYNVGLVLKEESQLSELVESGAHVLPMNVEALSVPFNPALARNAYVVTGWRMFINRPLNVADLFPSVRRFPAVAFVMHEQRIVGLDTLDSPHYSGLALDCHVARRPGAEVLLDGIDATAKRLLGATSRRAAGAKRKKPACAAQHGISLTKRRRKKPKRASR